MQTNPAVEQRKSVDGPRVRGINPVKMSMEERICWRANFFSSEWHSERVREDASGDSEDGEDDELPCVIGESAGDCVWRGSRRSVGSSFHIRGAELPVARDLPQTYRQTVP